jgi:hypothetical protein
MELHPPEYGDTRIGGRRKAERTLPVAWLSRCGG